jgi:hypothetical protein
MTTPWKIGLIALGYAAAIGAASMAVAIRMMATGQAAQAAGGMYAFGDLLLFVAVFGAIAALPTGVALYMLWSRIADGWR